jgi:uncharacterized protein (DUF2384 family)
VLGRLERLRGNKLRRIQLQRMCCLNCMTRGRGGIPLTAFSKFTGMSVAGLHKSPASASLQQHLIPIARSLTILTQLLGSKEAVRTWMNSPHPDLGDRTPIGVIEERRSQAVLEMLESALAGQPA